MAKKKKLPNTPSEMPNPGKEPEVRPVTVPENPDVPDEDPEEIPTEQPTEPSPAEIPPPKKENR